MTEHNHDDIPFQTVTLDVPCSTVLFADSGDPTEPRVFLDGDMLCGHLMGQILPASEAAQTEVEKAYYAGMAEVLQFLINTTVGLADRYTISNITDLSDLFPDA